MNLLLKQFRTRNLCILIVTGQLLIFSNKKRLTLANCIKFSFLSYYFFKNFNKPEILYFSLERDVFLLQVARPQRDLIFLDPPRLPRSLRSHIVLPSSVPVFHVLFGEFHCILIVDQ